MNGKGTITFLNANENPNYVIKGKFVDNQFVGEGTITLSEGSLYQVDKFADRWNMGQYSCSAVISEFPNGNQDMYVVKIILLS